MSNIQLSQQGRSLLQNLRHLFAGNHVTDGDIVSTGEETERYLATVFVVWRFEHDVTTSTSRGNAAISGGHFDYRATDYTWSVRVVVGRANRPAEHAQGTASSPMSHGFRQSLGRGGACPRTPGWQRKHWCTRSWLAGHQVRVRWSHLT